MRTLQFGSGSKLVYGDAEKHVVVDGVAHFYDVNGVLVGTRVLGEGDSVLEVEAVVAPAPEPVIEEVADEDYHEEYSYDLPV